jgi:hypothetical protein
MDHPALFCTFAALRSIRDGRLACRPRLFHGPAIPAEEAASVVNVHIHQFRPGGAVVDAAALASEASGQRGNSITRAPDTRPEPGSSARAALAQFQQQWATYRKLVEGDCLCHRELGGILHSTLNESSSCRSHSWTSPAATPS